MIPAFAASVLDRLDAAGFEAYIVGGSVRDSLMGREVNDYDITTSALPEEVTAVFSLPGDRVLPTGIRHGTVSVLSGGAWLEITTFRVDGDYSDGRHPDSVRFTRTLREDLSRRDFTVNAMAYSPRTGLADLFGGREDLREKIIRCVGNAEQRFTEDALRILRAFRFSAKLGFSIEPDTLRAAEKLSGRLSMVAPERIAKEFDGILLAEQPGPTLRLMRELGVLGRFLPEDDEMNFDAVGRAPADAALRFGTLLRGMKKETVTAALEGLRLSREYTGRAAAAACFPLPAGSDDAALRRFAGGYGNRAETVLAAAAAREETLPDGTSAAAASAALRRVLDAKPPLTLRDLAVNGSDLMREGIAFGRQAGQVLAALLDAVLADPSLNTREALLDAARKIKK